MYSDKKTLTDFMNMYRDKHQLNTLEKPPAPTGRIHYTGRPWKTKKVNDESARSYELHRVAYRLYCDRWYIEQRLRRIEKALDELKATGAGTVPTIESEVQSYENSTFSKFIKNNSMYGIRKEKKGKG